jgi:photosystem II Psb27 protein
MKRSILRLLALVLVAVIGLTGCSSGSTMTGSYKQDTLAVVTTLKTSITQLPGSAEQVAAQAESRQLINDFIALYRRDSSVSGLPSFTTMQTALNALAGHYSSFPNRPLPEKLKTRLEKEFRQVEGALNRGV